jgi:hypothetical protein
MHRRGQRLRWLAAGLGAGLGLAALAPAPAAACLWDDDTVAMEAKGMPEVIDIIAGRFEKNPPLYYEMRLTRAEARASADPHDLAAYDDGGVACDRLGRGDDAIAWMARKKVALDAVSDRAARGDHLYRYLANLGTFHAHRWVRRGAKRDDLDDLNRSRELIAAAIQENPNAHFGRERYQLLAIEAMLRGNTTGGGDGEVATFLEQPSWTERERQLFSRTEAMSPNDTLKELGYGDAVQGLTGLVALGNAWESVDVFYALARVLQINGETSLAYLAVLRVRELLDSGKRSMLVFGPSEGSELLKGPVELRHPEQVRAYFTLARESANRWSAQREAFMLERLRAGRHPDSDKAFWEGLRGEPPPRMPGDDVLGWLRAHLGVTTGATLGAAAGLWAAVRRRRRRASGRG